jgi:hypothetical protein
MQKTIKLKTHTTSEGIANYPYLFSPDTKFDHNGLYRTKLTLPKIQAKPIVDLVEETITEASSKNKGKLSPHKPYKSLKDGSVEFTFKLKAKVNTKSGTDFEQRPKVFDAKGIPITQTLSVYSGTKMKVAFQCVPYFTNMLGAGCTLRLKAVQIIELVEGKGNGENAEEQFGFSQEDGFEMKPTNQNVEVSQEEESDF